MQTGKRWLSVASRRTGILAETDRAGALSRSLPLRHAIALGLLHGPTELLPISSSGHTTLLPWFAGWSYDGLSPQLRKSFEVALHAGTALALLVQPPWRGRASGGHASDPTEESVEARLSQAGTERGFYAAALIPPAIAGYALGPQIERRLGTPATIAIGLMAGSTAMIASELRAHGTSRRMALACPPDGLALGLAQALALIPGVSRSGATIAVARRRGFSRREADRLSWKVGLPVIAGAALLKGTRLACEGIPPGLRLPLAAGAGSAFLSTLTATKVIHPERRATLIPACAAYRVALALLAIRRVRDKTRRRRRLTPRK